MKTRKIEKSRGPETDIRPPDKLVGARPQTQPAADKALNDAALLVYAFAISFDRLRISVYRGFFPGPLGEGCEANRVRELKTKKI